jgi:CRISPR/Cas system-associated endonuclease Cas3-HD
VGAMKNKNIVKEELLSSLTEREFINRPCFTKKLAELDVAVQLHQEILNKLKLDENNKKLINLYEQASNRIDELEESIIDELYSLELNENEYGEGWMIKSQLFNIARNAIRLHKMVDEKEDFEDWVQAKLTIADDYLETITYFIEYRKKTIGDFNADDKQQYTGDSDLSADESIPFIDDEDML